jgi:hypothetical protein
MSTTKELRRLGKGIRLLVTRIPERDHALVRFEHEPSVEQKAAIQFANDTLEVEPEYRIHSKHFRVNLEVLERYRKLGFEMVEVDLPK